MMEHDPLCEPLADYNMHWVPAEQCRICPKIRKIRADERERAAERVAALAQRQLCDDDEGCQGCDTIRDAVAAARGGA